MPMDLRELLAFLKDAREKHLARNGMVDVGLLNKAELSELIYAVQLAANLNGNQPHTNPMRVQVNYAKSHGWSTASLNTEHADMLLKGIEDARSTR